MIFWVFYIVSMRPIPLGAFVPPVTGTYGRPSAVASNRFDETRNFRPRTGSFKRARVGDEGDLDAAFDLTRDYPPLNKPPKPLFDCDAIKALMVTASEKAVTMKSKLENPNMQKLRNLLISIWPCLMSSPPSLRKRSCPLPMRPPPPAGRAIATMIPPQNQNLHLALRS